MSSSSSSSSSSSFEQRKQELGLTDDDLPPDVQANLAKAREFAESFQKQYQVQKQQQAVQQAQMQAFQEAAALARNVSLCSRVYVGSISFELSKADVIKIFEAFGFIKHVEMALDPTSGKHKGFCFVEYEAPEPATVALLHLQGAQLGGRSLKLGRPNNFPESLPNFGLPMFLPERIYVANIHEDISESDIAGVFEAFGKITQCSLIPDPTTRKHKTYGYIQFEKTEAADAAVTGMNGFDLGGRRLVVLKSIMGGPMPGGMDTMPELPSLINTALAGRVQLTIPAQPPVAPIPSAVSVALEQATATAAKIHVPQPTFLFQPQVPAPPVTSAKAVVAQPPPAPLPTLAPSSASAADLTAEENVSTISGKQRYEMMQKLAAARPNPRTIVLRDMVNPNEIDSELENEIKAECSKFGKVNKVVIHVGPENGSNIVKIFVQFNLSEEAAKANQVFDGRWFGGQQIRSQLYDDARFSAADYSG